MPTMILDKIVTIAAVAVLSTLMITIAAAYTLTAIIATTLLASTLYEALQLLRSFIAV